MSVLDSPTQPLRPVHVAHPAAGPSIPPDQSRRRRATIFAAVSAPLLVLTVLALVDSPADDASTTSTTSTCDTSRYNCGTPPVGCTELNGDIVCTMGKRAGLRYDTLEDIPQGRTITRDDSGWE